jgi:diadenosine tetraphosphatase ApaH/serine/threonine PP2A family protein phosphatase
VFEVTEALQEFTAFDERICFIGHSHFALFFVKEGDSCKVGLPRTFSIENDARYIVNVGSVGQPRDGLSTACFATYDAPGGVVHFHRVEYDLSLTYRKIVKARLPRFLAERLLIGE